MSSQNFYYGIRRSPLKSLLLGIAPEEDETPSVGQAVYIKLTKNPKLLLLK